MSERFFVELPVTGDSATLTGQEAQHLAKVLRARTGDLIILFDGSGQEFSARIDRVQRDSVYCTILERRLIDRELPRSIALGVALPKGDRQRVLVEKLTELGVTSLTPLVTRRGVVQPEEQTIVRLRRSVIEASKQCGRNRLMTISPPCPLPEFLLAANSSGLRLFAHPRDSNREKEPSSAREPNRTLRSLDWSREVTIAIGPEGGFTVEEVEQAMAAGWEPVDLGPRTLRVETAAIALTAIAGIT